MIDTPKYDPYYIIDRKKKEKVSSNKQEHILKLIKLCGLSFEILLACTVDMN